MSVYFPIEISGAEWEAFQSVILFLKYLKEIFWVFSVYFQVIGSCLVLNSCICYLTVYILAGIYLRGEFVSKNTGSWLSKIEILGMFGKFVFLFLLPLLPSFQ